MIIDRETGQEFEEKTYFGSALRLLYAKNPFSRFIKNVISRLPIFSKLWGGCQNLAWTRRKIAPFIQDYGLDTTEFEKNIQEFTSFNDFFIRKLKKGVRPIQGTICMPADGRYLAFENIAKSDGFFVKGQKFSLTALLQDAKLAGDYQSGSIVIARLAPPDYHRFHFPIDGVPGPSKLINGPLFSVNPLALRQNIHRLTENKRMITQLQTTIGCLLMIEVGATNVGTIHQTFQPGKRVEAGDEKGYFSFGGSALLLLFPKKSIAIDPQLLQNSKRHLETRCLMGQILARPL